jgi:hypothetical protein
MLMELLNGYNLLKTAGYYVAGVLGPLLHLVLAVAVWRDARGRAPVLLRGGLWAASTLLLGLPALALYWAAHHSTLRGAVGPAK